VATDADTRVAIARRGIEAYAAGALETALELFAPDVVIFAPPGEQITSGTYHGIEGFLRWSGEWNDAWESFDLEVIEIEAVGERHAVAEVRQRGIGKGSGLEVEGISGYVFENRDDGLCTWFALYNDVERAREAARERERTSDE
jgi:ketosteroid isomerase-like protein